MRQLRKRVLQNFLFNFVLYTLVWLVAFPPPAADAVFFCKSALLSLGTAIIIPDNPISMLIRKLCKKGKITASVAEANNE